MYSPLVSGTSINPTLGVASPPGLRFYSEVKPIPVVYGNAIVEGTTIDDISKLLTSYNSSGDASLWQAICFGEITLYDIIVGSSLRFLPGGLNWLPSNFNSGSSDPGAFDNSTPVIYQKSAASETRVAQQFLSPLHGVSHYYFNQSHPIPWTSSEKKTVEKIRYNVSRKLNTGLSVHGDDIPFDRPVVSDFMSTVVRFDGGLFVPGGWQYEDRTILLTPSNGTFVNIATGTPFYFVTPPPPLQLFKYKIPGSEDLHEFEAGVPYYFNGIGSLPDPDYGHIRITNVVGGDDLIYGEDGASNIAYYATIALTQERPAGNNPASVIFDLLTNRFYGLGLDSTIDINTTTGVIDLNLTPNQHVNVASFWRVLEYYYNNPQKPYGVNCSFQQQSSAREMIKKIQEWTDCILTLDSEGKYYLTTNDPARLYTQGRMGGIALPGNVVKDENGVPRLSRDDFPSFTPSYQTIDNTTNEFRAKFTSFADSFTSLEAFYRDESNIAATGTIRSADYDLQGFVFPEIVTTRILEIAKRESFPITTISSICKIGLISAYVNDIWRITHSEYGIDDYFKIVSMGLSEIEIGQVSVQWKQCSELLFDLFGSNIVKALAAVPKNTNPEENVQNAIINLTFPSLSNISTARATPFTVDSASIVAWGDEQEQGGVLVYTVDDPVTGDNDYTIRDHDKIVLNATKWQNSIQANVLGLLNVNTQQGT
jgi:hypothetical protein